MPAEIADYLLNQGPLGLMIIYLFVDKKRSEKKEETLQGEIRQVLRDSLTGLANSTAAMNRLGDKISLILNKDMS